MANELAKMYVWVVEHPEEGEMVATKMAPSPMFGGGIMLGSPLIAPTRDGAMTALAELQQLSNDRNVTVRLYEFDGRHEIAAVAPKYTQRNGH